MPVIERGSDYFNVVTYTGDGASSRNITGVGFQPDMVWIKGRSQATDHRLADAVRGGGKILQTNLTDAEASGSSPSAFLSDGFTVVNGAGVDAATNVSGQTYVAWCWKANGAGVSNTAGTINSTVSANTTAGFSIVTYTGNGTTGATIGHGLGAKPGLMIIKKRSAAGDNWRVYHSSLGATKFLDLNQTSSVGTASSVWNDTEPTSTVWTVGTNGEVNTNTATYVCYAFAPVSGYSAAFSYTGNGSTDGPFVNLNFRPALIILKRTDTSGNNWGIYDKLRSNPFNVVNGELLPSSSAAESTSFGQFDFTSNGFKIRSTNGGENASGGTYVGFAWAENPFKLSLAR